MADETTPDPQGARNTRSSAGASTTGRSTKGTGKKTTTRKSAAKSTAKGSTAKSTSKKTAARSSGTASGSTKAKSATGGGKSSRTAAAGTATRSRSKATGASGAAGAASGGSKADTGTAEKGLSKRTEDLLWRLIAMVAFGFVGVFALYLLFVLAAVQYLVTVLRGRPHDEVQRGLGWLHGYLRQILTYLCFETEQMPWPLGELPETVTPGNKRKS